MQRLTVLGAELPMLFLHIHYRPLTRPQFHISPFPLSRHPPHVPNPPHQDLSLDLAIPLPPFHKSVHSSCPFDLGEQPSCLLVLYSDEDFDYLQTRFLLPNLLKPRYTEGSRRPDIASASLTTFVLITVSFSSPDGPSLVNFG